MSNSQQKGKLTVITGCMFSGKTTRLIALAREAMGSGKNIEIYYPEIDTRYTKNYITSHDQISLPSKPLSVDREAIEAGGKKIIFLDEIHFFKQTIIETIQKLLDAGVDVIVSGLDTDFRNEPFMVTQTLMGMADDVVKLEAKCNVCGKSATCTQRVLGDQYASKDAETIVVGGADMYEARCAEHFIKPE